METTISAEARTTIENYPVALATVTPEGKPNVIGVVAVKVINRTQLLITDAYMRQTLTDIAANSNVALVVWNDDLYGYKVLGKVAYFSSGPWLKRVQQLPENQEFEPKGALVITVTHVIKSAQHFL